MARVKVQVPIDELAEQLEAPAAVEAAPFQASTPNQIPKRKFLGLGMLGLGIVVGLVAVVLILVMLLNDRNHLKQEVSKLSTTQASTTQNDAQKYQDEIGKIVELPTGQTPSLIPVKDAKTLAAGNQFFKNAQDGDVVLLYVSPDKSVRAILYRPSTHKVVEATSSATVGAGTTTSPVKQ